jgi:hypothetical protein
MVECTYSDSFNRRQLHIRQLPTFNQCPVSNGSNGWNRDTSWTAFRECIISNRFQLVTKYNFHQLTTVTENAAIQLPRHLA